MGTLPPLEVAEARNAVLQGRLAVALRGSLGWPLTEQPLNVVRKYQTSSAPGGQEQLFSDHELAFLKSMNRHDEELHRHAAFAKLGANYYVPQGMKCTN